MLPSFPHRRWKWTRPQFSEESQTATWQRQLTHRFLNVWGRGRPWNSFSLASKHENQMFTREWPKIIRKWFKIEKNVWNVTENIKRIVLESWIWIKNKNFPKYVKKKITEIFEKLSNCGATRSQSSEEMNILWPFGEHSTIFNKVSKERCSNKSKIRYRPSVISSKCIYLVGCNLKLDIIGSR